MATKRARLKSPAAPSHKASRVKRKQFTPEERSKILAAARAQKLTGKQVAEKFGISQVTYYLWKSRVGKPGRKPGARQGSRSSAVGIESSVREAVRERIREAIPGIVRTEVGLYLEGVLGGKRRKL